MKTMLLFMASIFPVIAAFAQDSDPVPGNSGIVIYEQVVKLEIKLEGEAAHMADMLPKERKSEKLLRFNETASLYENNQKEEEEPVRMESGANRVMIRMNEPKNVVYTDMTQQEQIEFREFMTREFLIGSKVNSSEWKLTGNQKAILNYPCQEAVRTTKEGKTTAWFTPLIPVSSGPGSFTGLPGLVLAVDINDGKQTFTATSVRIQPVETSSLEKPDKGKKVTREEYDKIVEEKMKEMGGESGPGGTRIMIRMHP